MTIEFPFEDDVTQLANRVEKARGRLAYQFDPALTEALSEEELAAERELAERIRIQDREQRWKQVQATAAAADRARATGEEIEKADMRDLLMARKAIAAQRRESSPHAKLASLYKHRAWSLRALAGVVGAGMLWSAVNVQQNIAPGGPGNPLFWFSYLLEGMISVCLIIIMIGTNKVAEWGVLENRRQVHIAEFALLSLTVGLNTYPYVAAGDWYETAVHAVAPVMIGVALLIHNAVSARYGQAIGHATEQIRGLPDPAEQIRQKLQVRRLSTMADYKMTAPHQAVEKAPERTETKEGSPKDPVLDAETVPAEDAEAAGKGRTPALEAAPADRKGTPATTKNGAAPKRNGTASATAATNTISAPAAPEKRTTAAETTRASAAAAAELDAIWAETISSPVISGKSKDDKDSSDASDIYDTGQFRVADDLERELAEMQAERRRARTTKQRRN
ncbi:hypothetical protein [Nocardia otitidiscaviarum]|uniref:hypothetical protein n=1 Tax=Nocardia otitidiscaviarum TaxID=1823 RepID=UPI0024540DB2|nr:hypothetical protein [Nocardia otitidiscaviarum]